MALPDTVAYRLDLLVLLVAVIGFDLASDHAVRFVTMPFFLGVAGIALWRVVAAERAHRREA